MNELYLTEDGSHTLYSEHFKEHYHSVHGAIQESQHVFIEACLDQCKLREINLLEIGFGTGLNALLSLIEGERSNLKINYTTIDLYPLVEQEIKRINYSKILGFEQQFRQIHSSNWEEWQSINESFHLKKLQADLTSVILEDLYDVIFFDAFSPVVQPELWSTQIFNKLANCSHSGCILTTYSAKGAVRRSLMSAGFEVARIPGPPGKREMIRATMP